LNAIAPKVRQILEGYAQGLYSAREAARRMGDDATIHDVIDQMREASIPLPRHTAGPAEMAKARKMFGLAP
jgi:hypothetical protein